MTIVHRRSVTINAGRGSAVAAMREYQKYHDANGVAYEIQIAFGGEASRIAMAARYDGSDALYRYFRKVMADAAFLELTARHAACFVPGSARDEFWRVLFPPAKASDGPLLHARILGVLPGRLGHAAGIMKELVDYLGASGVGYMAIAPSGVGDPMRVGLVARYPGAAELEAFTTRITADPKWQEIVARNAYNLVPGGMSDHMWITV